MRHKNQTTQQLDTSLPTMNPADWVRALAADEGFVRYFLAKELTGIANERRRHGADKANNGQSRPKSAQTARRNEGRETSEEKAGEEAAQKAWAQMIGMGRFKAIKCIDPWKDNGSWPTAFRTKAITPIGKSHLENLKRVYLFVLLPAALVDATQMFQKATDKIIYTKAKSSTPKPIFAKMVNQEVERVLAERDKIMTAGGPAVEQLNSQMNRMGYGLLDTLPQDLIAPGILSWLSAQITGTWTTFETLSDELWTAALNAHPEHLAELSGNTGTRKKGDQGKSIKFDDLQKHHYDLSKVMGSIHRDRYSFDRLEGIREAYTDASFKKDARITAAISDPSLDAISLLRNVIVHNGGAYDKEYLERSAKFPILPQGNAGESIHLDGELIAALLGPVIKTSWDLIAAVDDWLADHGAEAP